VVRATEKLLDNFQERVERLRASGEDLSAWDTFEFAGVSGTTMEDTPGFDVARWLIRRMPGNVEIAWDNFEPGRDAVAIWPRFIPLLDDDANVEADTPWRQWLEAAHGKKSGGAEWLMRRFEELPLFDGDKAILYDSLRLPLRWSYVNSRMSRTRNWDRPRKIFFHTEPLITRGQVSLAHELARKPPAFTRLSRAQGLRVMDRIREVMLARYRELYGTTLGDPASVVRADLGRGLSIYLWNLPPERRLPLRSYVAGFSLKNGVPINYIEAIGICEWMEVGFNTFYTFRGGETGWIYAQVLRCLSHMTGASCVSVYPYQLGHENEEAIESGAFWFYRKLGFRPGRPELLRLVEHEERRIKKDSKYRTSARTLRRLAASHVFYELPGTEVGAWDRFSTRNIGLRANAGIARSSSGDRQQTRARMTKAIAQTLGINLLSCSALEKRNFEDFAVALSLVRDLSSWTPKEKSSLVRLIRAKAAPDEMKFLQFTQKHERFRKTLMKTGS
jgi:hypothetical protein